MSDQNPDAPPPNGIMQMSADEQAQVRAVMEEQSVRITLELLQALAPSIPPSKLEGFIRGVFKQQGHADFTRILDDATDPKTRAEIPRWGVRLYKRGEGNNPKAKPLVLVEIDKDPATLKNADEALQYVTVLGLITNPQARSLLLALGFEPHFFQKKRSALVTL